MNTKQVIVMRKDLNMRKGKMIVQGAHASLGALLSLFNKQTIYHEYSTDPYYCYCCNFGKDSVLDLWLNGKFTKVCVYVNSEEELLDIYNKVLEKDFPCKLIIDAGLTEFNGVPTKTCLGIGPWISEELDEITGKLPLL